MLLGPQMQQLRQRVIASYHLGPLDRTETQAYIEHRLRHVGWTTDPEFDPGCFPVIHAMTGGIPRRINRLCNRLMLAAFLAEKHRIEAGDVQAVGGEIRDEMGPESAFEGAVPDRPVGAAAPAPAAAPSAEYANWETHFRHLEERIDRLDRTVGAAVDLLHSLLHPDKPLVRSGNTGGR
jgi:hypothetical protein